MYAQGARMTNELFIKLLLIFFMLFCVMTLSASAYFMQISYHEKVAFIHTSVGTIFLIILPLHIYLRKEKLLKMMKDFYSAFIAKELDSSCTNHKLLKSFKQRTLKEICTLLNIEMNETLIYLRQKNIRVENEEDNLQKISENNSYDSLKIFAMIIEIHIRKLKQ